MPYYAIKKGTNTSIKTSWPEAQKYMASLPSGKGSGEPTLNKKFSTEEEAKNWIGGEKKENIPVTEWEIYTDGSAHLHKKSGYGFVIIHKGQKVVESYGKIEKYHTSSYAELTAVSMAIEYFSKRYSGDLTIHADSKYVIDILKDDLQTPHIYQELIQGLRDYISRYRAYHTLNFHHVSAHKGVEFNERADELAAMGSSL
jgi:ribonuclease HI